MIGYLKRKFFDKAAIPVEETFRTHPEKVMAVALSDAGYPQFVITGSTEVPANPVTGHSQGIEFGLWFSARIGMPPKEKEAELRIAFALGRILNVRLERSCVQLREDTHAIVGSYILMVRENPPKITDWSTHPTVRINSYSDRLCLFEKRAGGWELYVDSHWRQYQNNLVDPEVFIKLRLPGRGVYHGSSTVESFSRSRGEIPGSRWPAVVHLVGSSPLVSCSGSGCLLDGCASNWFAERRNRVESQALRLHSGGLLSRWGFYDGDAPRYLRDYWNDHPSTEPDSWRAVLVQLVRAHLLPALAQHHRIEVEEVDTIHNPIRAIRVDGQVINDSGPNAGIRLEPEWVDVPHAVVIAACIGNR